MVWFVLLVLAVGVERVVELVVSQRNSAWSRARGGQEYGAGLYPWMAALHTALLVGAVLEAWWLNRPFVPVLGWPMLGVVLLAQTLRWWCIGTLGRQWNVRVIVVPGLGAVRRGPYAVLRHPNYVAVIAEGFALPLVRSAWVTAVVFTVLNALVLRSRIRTENVALQRLSAMS